MSEKTMKCEGETNLTRGVGRICQRGISGEIHSKALLLAVRPVLAS